MEIKYKYEFIVNGEVVDRVTSETQEELIAIMKSLKHHEKRFVIEVINDE